MITFKYQETFYLALDKHIFSIYEILQILHI